MQNETTTVTTITNTQTVAGSLDNLGTITTGLVNRLGGSGIVDQTPLPDARTEGLWVRFVQPWELPSPWTYEAIQKSNVEITNL